MEGGGRRREVEVEGAGTPIESPQKDSVGTALKYHHENIVHNNFISEINIKHRREGGMRAEADGSQLRKG